LEFAALLCSLDYKLALVNLPTQITELEGLQVKTHLRLLSKIIRLAKQT